ncbi:cell envelope integrity protein TolA [Lysobacter sp. TY2-98]|uniref:cell envelope integrity protein TolA n=1 Tax=Lysobacter sp. TY2-98 TaxID=2290922 RepID=UPI000E1FD9C6|nr:cell envelope integrity protein TolA [Lysobacter sp. TY2-98]AXK71022.1 cell envelope integrity protein TolA [Lysobacter sp. TY2-98]
MRPADDATAVALAIALHVALALLLWFAMRPSENVQASAGGMAADVVDVGQLSAAMQRTLRHRPEPVEEPLPEPVPEEQPEPVPEQQPKPQEQLAQPDDVDQQAVVETPTPQKAIETKPQEEKHRQQQADLTNPADAQADAQQKLKAEREAQLAEIRRRRAAASREALAAEERLAQLTAPRGGSAAQQAAQADAQASGSGPADDGLLGRYAAALQEAIRAKWVRPDNIPSGAMCRLVIRQLPGGEVIDAQVSSPCVYDEAGRRSIEAAVLKAQPLPYAGFEKVFKRELTLNFRAP